MPNTAKDMSVAIYFNISTVKVRDYSLNADVVTLRITLTELINMLYNWLPWEMWTRQKSNMTLMSLA